MSLDVRGEMFTVIIIILIIIIYLYLYLYLLWCAPKRSPPNCAKLICIYYLLQLQLSTAGKYEGVTASFLEGTLGSHAFFYKTVAGYMVLNSWSPSTTAISPSGGWEGAKNYRYPQGSQGATNQVSQPHDDSFNWHYKLQNWYYYLL